MWKIYISTKYCMEYIKGSRAEWCTSSMMYSRDTLFWLGTLDMYQPNIVWNIYINQILYGIYVSTKYCMEYMYQPNIVWNIFINQILCGIYISTKYCTEYMYQPKFEGSQPEWCISSIIYSTLEILYGIYIMYLVATEHSQLRTLLG